MAGVRVFLMKSGVNHASQTFRSFAKFDNGIANYKYPNSVSRCLDDIADTRFRVKDFHQPLVHSRSYRMEPISAFSHRCLKNNGSMNLHSWNPTYPVSVSSMSRKYSSFFGSKGGDGPRESEVSVPSVANQSNVDSTDVGGTDWSANLKNAWQSTVDAAIYMREKAEAASNELTPHVQQLHNTYPYLIPVGGTLTGTLLAWLVMPKVLRKLHKYTLLGPTALLTANSPLEKVPYEKSFWGALEDPVRYLVTFMALIYTGMMIAPTTITPQYIPGAWRGAVIVSFVLFIHRWKTSKLTRALGSQNIFGLDQEGLLALNQISSGVLFILGSMALAESCGVAVQSVLTVGGIGGVAAAFAARDILGNVLSGLSMRFSKRFSPGDTIKAGSIEGQVIEMGLITTLLLNAENFSVTVPNSLFSNQVIVKTRAEWRAMLTKIPLRVDDVDKIPQISDDIKSMLRSNAKTFLGKDAPYCFLSRIENNYGELTIGCNLKHMSKDELYSTQQDILLQAAHIIKKHGATIGNTTV